MRAHSAIVIGAGIGGIGAAIHLARRGLRVTVVEKNSQPGGRCGRFSRLGHHFDTGPTLLIMPLVYEAEFSALGTSLQSELELCRVDPTYNVIFDDGDGLALTPRADRLRDQLEALEPGSFDGWRRYMKEGGRHYDLVMETLVNRDFRRPSDFFTARTLAVLLQVKPFVHHYDNMRRYFARPRLKGAFTFQDVYMGLSPFEAPATFSLLPFTEMAHGVWYPRGGMYRIVEALVEMATRAGVEFLFDVAVQRIDVQAKRAGGVTLEDGRRLSADVVLANADLPYVYKELLPSDGLATRLEHKRFSCSVISFFWGVKKRYEALGPHTLFLADDYRANFDSIVRDLGLPRNPSLYVHAPTRLDPSMAPPGEDTLTAIVPVGHMSADGDQDWSSMRDQARESVFRRLATLGILDLKQNIKFEVCYSPPSWRSLYNLMKGSTHGLCHNWMQLGCFRPPNRHPRYANLYFAGASTHPGTGLPTALVSGRLAAQRIMDELET